jgi:hypothetical protein
MQQIAPTIDISARTRARTVTALAGVVALLAVAVVALVLAVSGDEPTDVSRPAAVQSQSQSFSTRPDEARTAAAVGATRSASPAPARPDESTTAAAVSNGGGSPTTTPARPDESSVATAISGTTEAPTQALPISGLRTGP